MTADQRERRENSRLPQEVPDPRIGFVVHDATLIAQFFLLLQQGVSIRRRVGCSVDEFLRAELGASAGTIERIQSLVLDGKPVDDLRTALVHEGSVLALSAAMPGLVGATLRRGGAYSSFRSAITYHEPGRDVSAGEGWVGIKLFNLLLAELGPGLLRKGVRVETAALLDLLAERMHDLERGCRVQLEGGVISLARCREGTALAGRAKVMLTVSSGPAGG